MMFPLLRKVLQPYSGRHARQDLYFPAPDVSVQSGEIMPLLQRTAYALVNDRFSEFLSAIGVMMKHSPTKDSH